jgi:hypothetical protein
MVKIYTQKTTGFESIILKTYSYGRPMARWTEHRWEKNKQHKRENVDTNRKDTF